MIVLPKSDCSPCSAPATQYIYELPVLEDCYCTPIEDHPPLVSLLPSTLCPCPVKESFVPEFNPPRKTQTKIVVCYGDFIKSVVQTKLCGTGPKCG